MLIPTETLGKMATSGAIGMGICAAVDGAASRITVPPGMLAQQTGQPAVRVVATTLSHHVTAYKSHQGNSKRRFPVASLREAG